MVNIKISIHNRNLKHKIEGIRDWNISQEDKKDIIRFLDDLEIGKVNKGVRVGENTRNKYLEMLKISLEFLDKPTSKLNSKDTERFERAMISDELCTKIKMSNGKFKPFTQWSKLKIKTALKIYLKWKLKDKAVSLTDWFDMKKPKNTVDFLKELEIEELYKYCKSPEERFFIAVLFDSGARAEEFHNIRFEDIELPTKENNYVKLTLKQEYSKTEGRTISLYWKHSLESVRDYLNVRTKQGIKSNDVVYSPTYDNSRQFLNRIGKKVLNKNLHYHLFRHSSATFYADKMNRQLLCIRYGWKFSSPMPDTYIARIGLNNQEIDEKFSAENIQDLNNKFEKERLSKDLEIEQNKKRIAELEEQVKNNSNKTDEVLKRIESLSADQWKNLIFMAKESQKAMVQ